MTEVSKHERDERKWYSPPFYSGPGGYKLCLCVVNDNYWNKVFFQGSMPVCVYLMRGEYDDSLVWPFCGDITVQLVNLISDQDHQEQTFKFDGESSISSRSRVTSGERAESGCSQRRFTPRDSKNAKYIKDDCVRFRVTKVLVTL